MATYDVNGVVGGKLVGGGINNESADIVDVVVKEGV